MMVIPRNRFLAMEIKQGLMHKSIDDIELVLDRVEAKAQHSERERMIKWLDIQIESRKHHTNTISKTIIKDCKKLKEKLKRGEQVV